MMTRLLTVGLATAVALALAAPASATTVDFTGAGTVDYDIVSQSYGDSAEADLSYRSLTGGNNWGQTATELSDHVDYWADANYSGDQAIFASSNNSKQEISLAAGAGLHFTSITFDLGGYSNADKVVAFRLYDASWNQLLSNDAFAIDHAAGGLISLAVNTTALHFQMGDDWNAGTRSISFATAAATPLPPALLMFLTAVGGIGLTGWHRRRRATAA